MKNLTSHLPLQIADLKKTTFIFLSLFTLSILKSDIAVYASSGEEGASFLDIPVGAGPAAMGGAYTSLANDAYAATYNPGGLGFLESTQFSGQHLSYLESIHYEYLSFAVPLKGANCASGSDCPGSAIGGSVQYLGSGDIQGMDQTGAPTGEFSSYYAAYNLSYGRSLSEKLSLGLTGKMINAKLDDVSANAFAADLGAMYKVQGNLMLAASLTNVGSKLKFLSEGDSLPMAFHVGGSWRPSAQWMVTSEVVYPKTGLASFHIGGEWRPLEMLALRTGYRTDTVKELSALAGYSLGLGLNVWGQELGYAWLPYGDLGNTHYISLLMKFGEVEKSKRNLIQYQHIKKHKTAKDRSGSGSRGRDREEEMAPDYQQLMELLNDNEQRVVQGGRTGNNQ
jgi:hypothetical protein